MEEYLEELSNHFLVETRLVKRVDELNNKYSLCKLSTCNTKILLEQTKQRFGEDHERTKQVEKEIELLYRNDRDFREKLSKCINDIEDIKNKREELKSQWEVSDVTTHGKKLLNLQFAQHCHIIDKITLELQDTDDEDWNRRLNQLKEMDEQIHIRDKLIREAATQLKKLKVSTLFQNSLLVRNPYSICVNELSDTENFPKKLRAAKLSTNNSLPQLNTYKQTIHEEEEKGNYNTPKQVGIRHEKTNSSYESPYLQKKHEIDEMINKRYLNLNRMTAEKRAHLHEHKDYSQGE